MQADDNNNTNMKQTLLCQKCLIKFIVSVHVLIIVWMSFWNSPNGNEPGHLAAGIYTLRFGRTDLYRVNPPLVRTIAAIPAAYLLSIDANWLSTASNVLAMRPEYEVGNSLYFKNDPDKLKLAFSLGRLMLLPFTLLGAWICYIYARELFGSNAAFCSLVFWCFNPYVLTWASTINPEIGSTSLGIFTFHLFWKWCRNNNWKNTVLVGIAAGFLLAAKTMWIIVFPLFFVLWCVSFLLQSDKKARSLFGGVVKLAAIFVLALTVLNAFYNFHGTCKPLGHFTFVSKSLVGSSADSHLTKNRFTDTAFAHFFVPFPQDFIYGIDVQKVDFERGIPSYLNGKWSDRGFWYFYLYAFLIKTPIAFHFLILIAVFLFLFFKQYLSDAFSEILLVVPLFVIFVLISSQTGFSIHSRYMLPVFPFLFIWVSRVGILASFEDAPVCSFSCRKLSLCVTILLLFWYVGSVMFSVPHTMSYFNEYVGGPVSGVNYLLGSDLDWGQDVYYLQRWQKKYAPTEPLHVSLFGCMPLENTKIKYAGPVPVEGNGTEFFATLTPGWYAVNITNLYKLKNEYETLRNMQPTAIAGTTIYLYHFTAEQINIERVKQNLPTLKEDIDVQCQIVQKLKERVSNRSDLARIQIAVYAGKGAAFGSIESIREVIKSNGGEISIIDIPQIREGKISDFEILVVPGGVSLEMADALGRDGCDAIRQFVRSGGGYIGICAGAYLASSTFEKFLGLINVKTNHSTQFLPGIGTFEQRQLGCGDVQIVFSEAGKSIFSTKQMILPYINGPIFMEAGRVDLPRHITFGMYNSDIFQYQFQQGTMPQTPAIVFGQYGKGMAILFSPHPELTKNGSSLVIDAVYAVRKQ